MATFEELLYKTISGHTAITGKLAKYANEPAVFEKQAPADSDRGWNGGNQYPRLEYVAVFQDDPERKIAGTATFDIAVELDNQDGPETIEGILRGLIDGAFFETNVGTIAARWQRTDIYDQVDDKITGMVVVFDLLAFPRQTLPSNPPKPDPIAGLIAWTKTLLGENGAFFIDAMPQEEEFWKPAAYKPAVYWRFVRQNVSRILNSAVWFNATCACHIIAPTPADRIPFIRRITEGLAMQRYVELPNGSFLYFKGDITADSNSDMLSVGQTMVTGQYGIMRTKNSVLPINHIHFR